MANETILVVDDEADVLELAEHTLSLEGYSVIGARTGEDASFKAKKHAPDLILLALTLPGANGLDVYKRLKSDERTQDIPIVLLAANGEEADIVTGLEMGADGYISKPFSPPALLAHLHAVLERGTTSQPNDASIAIHELVIHPGRKALTLGGQSIQLTSTEFKVLHCLARRPGWEITRGQIADAMQGGNVAVTERTVDAQIAALRKKLGHADGYIETVRGVGYRFKE